MTFSKKRTILSLLFFFCSIAVVNTAQAHTHQELIAHCPQIMIVDKETLLKDIENVCDAFEEKLLADLDAKGLPLKAAQEGGPGKIFFDKFISEIDAIAGISVTYLDVIDVFKSVVGFEQMRLINIKDLEKDVPVKIREPFIKSAQKINWIFFVAVYNLITDVMLKAVQNDMNAVNFIREARKVELSWTSDIMAAAGNAKIQQAATKRFGDELEKLKELYFKQ